MTDPTPIVPAKPMTLDEIMDLRRRVLAGETVSDDDLRNALASMAQVRINAGTGTPTKPLKPSAVAVPKLGNLGDAFAAFKAKKEQPQS